MCTTQQVCSVKNIRICHPQEPSSARSSKSDANTLVSNKVLDTDPGPGFDFSFIFSNQFSFYLIIWQLFCLFCSDTAACSYRVRDLTPSRQSSKLISDKWNLEVLLPVPVPVPVRCSLVPYWNLFLCFVRWTSWTTKETGGGASACAPCCDDR